MKKEFLYTPAAMVLPIINGMLFHYWWAIITFAPNSIIRPFSFMLMAFIVMAVLTNRLLRNWQHTGLFITAINIAVYTPGNLFPRIAITAMVVLFGVIISLKILKRKIDANSLIKSLFFYNLVICISAFYQLSKSFAEIDWIAYSNSIIENKASLPQNTAPTENKPDIYYIVLDGYGGHEMLQTYYQFDNSDMVQFLKKAGFIVPENAKSGYSYTALSVSSTLNMNYILDIAPVDENSSFWWLMKPYIQDSKVQLFLEQAGYQSIALASIFDITNNKKTDLYIAPSKIMLTEFESYLLKNTAWKIFLPMFTPFANITDHDTHRELISYTFNALAEAPDIGGPKFVFVHIVAPHPPFVFDKNGMAITPEYEFSFADGHGYPGTDSQYKKQYTDQIQHINTLIKAAVTSILERSEIPPIILLQADHGPRMLQENRYAEKVCLDERFSIFAAYHLPGIDQNSIINDLTTINIFRIILNEYFSTELEMLDNHAYLPTDRFKIYHTEPVDLNAPSLCLVQP